MNRPKAGDKVRIAKTLHSKFEDDPFFPRELRFKKRIANAAGTFHGHADRANGEVWWVKHGDGTIGVYKPFEVFPDNVRALP